MTCPTQSQLGLEGCAHSQPIATMDLSYLAGRINPAINVLIVVQSLKDGRDSSQEEVGGSYHGTAVYRPAGMKSFLAGSSDPVKWRFMASVIVVQSLGGGSDGLSPGSSQRLWFIVSTQTLRARQKQNPWKSKAEMFPAPPANFLWHRNNPAPFRKW